MAARKDVKIRKSNQQEVTIKSLEGGSRQWLEYFLSVRHECWKTLGDSGNTKKYLDVVITKG